MKVRMLLAFLLLAVTVSAQTFRGTILGTVTDATGAVVTGAKIIVRNTGTGLERSTETSGDGSYSVSELPIGTYAVTVAQKGFQTSIVRDIAVNVAAERRVDFALKPGEVATQVEVTGELQQVETTSAELGGTLTAANIADLPVNGRDFTKLVYLNPGIAGSPDQISDSPGSYGMFSMNGSRGRANNFLLDGTDMNDGYRNDPAINEAGVFGTPATILPVDAVAELRVLSNYEAEYGRNSGAVINTVTKSGTNTLHGTLLEYWRSGQAGARNYFNTTDSPKNSFLNNQFGGALGGPIKKDKTFFYVDYEGQRESGKQSGTSCVPDPAVIASESATITEGGGTLNAVTQALLARHPWPTPNIAGAVSDASGCTNDNLSTATPFRNRVDSFIGKIDQNFSANNMLTGRYYLGDSDQSFPFAQLAAGLLPGFNTVTPTRVQLVAVSYVHIVNSAQLNEARLGWNRFAEGFFPEDQSFNPSSIGLNTGVSSYEGGLPGINVGNFSQVGATNGIPRNRVDANWHFVDGYSWKAGRHDVKFGYEFRRTTIMQRFERAFRGTLSFDNLDTFLEGIPSDGSQASGNTLRHTFQNSHAFYVQDSFRITPRFTMNWGVRWDYFGVIGEKNNLLYTFDPTANGGAGDNVQTKQLYSKDFNNFAPRLAFDYDLTGKGKTVIRAGWGLFYDAFAQDIFLGHLPWNCVFCPGPAYPGTGTNAVTKGGITLDYTDPKNPVPVALAANVPVYSNFAAYGDFFATDPKMRTPYTQNFNLNLQQALGTKAVLQVGYVGTRGTKLFRFRDINQPSQAQITAYDTSAAQCVEATVPNCPIAGFDAKSNVPRPSNFYYLNMEESKASSTYHALQASFRTNAWHGLTSTANFVWSHAVDDASDSEDFLPNQAQPQNSTNPRGDRGNSSFDIRRRLTWNFSYEFPKMGGSMAKLKNGWAVDGILNLQDGQPFHLNYEFQGDYSGAGEGFDRPDVTAPIHYGKAPFEFLDLGSFHVPCTFGNTTADPTLPTGDGNCLAGTRHFGNLGRNSLRGPTFKELNFSIAKKTAITERMNLEIRAEFFNLFNHPNFSNPAMPNFIANIGDPTATGQHSGFYQITATGDVGIGNPFLGGGGPRGVQFAAKITF
jgi:hypothetical protein